MGGHRDQIGLLLADCRQDLPGGIAGPHSGLGPDPLGGEPPHQLLQVLLSIPLSHRQLIHRRDMVKPKGINRGKRNHLKEQDLHVKGTRDLLDDRKDGLRLRGAVQRNHDFLVAHRGLLNKGK